jgi:hypothetical protein
MNRAMGVYYRRRWEKERGMRFTCKAGEKIFAGDRITISTEDGWTARRAKLGERWVAQVIKDYEEGEIIELEVVPN